MTKTCPWCHKEFETDQYQKIFCCNRCGSMYNYHNGHGHGYISITFECAECGRTVVTEGGRDHRSRFCSVECERKYWRHPPSEDPHIRQNWRSIDEYASWERRTNR